IPLGASSPIRSSNLPGDTAGHGIVSLFGLAPGGVCRAGLLPGSRCALTAPFHPCRLLERNVGGIFLLHFPSARAAQALPGTVPCGARTFLGAVSSDATVRPTPPRALSHDATQRRRGPHAARGRGPVRRRPATRAAGRDGPPPLTCRFRRPPAADDPSSRPGPAARVARAPRPADLPPRPRGRILAGVVRIRPAGQRRTGRTPPGPAGRQPGRTLVRRAAAGRLHAHGGRVGT